MKDSKVATGQRRCSAAQSRTQGDLAPLQDEVRARSKCEANRLDAQSRVASPPLEASDMVPRRSTWDTRDELPIAAAGLRGISDTYSGSSGMGKTEKTLSMVALEEMDGQSDGAVSFDNLSDAGSSSSVGVRLNRYQEDLLTALEARGVQVLLSWDSNCKPTAQGHCSAACIVTQIPSTVDAQDMLETLVSQKLAAPTFILIVRSPKQVTMDQEALLQETNKFLEQGAADVVLQPLAEDPQACVDMWIARARARTVQAESIRKKEKKMEDEVDQILDVVSAREDGLFWEQAHNFCDGLPRVNMRLHEPEIGVMMGKEHKVLEGINSGAFSDVFLVQNSKKETLAMKAVKKEKLGKFDLVKCVGNEIRILRRLRHPHIVHFSGAAQSREHIVILMEFAGRVNLFSYIKKHDGKDGHPQFELPRMKEMFHQMMLAIAYCHEQKISHRDIKPENFSVSENGTVKLVDFGMAEELSAPLKYKGTMPFIAPEVIEEDFAVYSPAAADVWSMGVVLMEMLCGLHALSRILKWQKVMSINKALATDLRGFLTGPGRLHKAMKDHIRPTIELTTCLDDLLHGMLTTEIPSRWPAASVVKSEWLGRSKDSR